MIPIDIGRNDDDDDDDDERKQELEGESML